MSLTVKMPTTIIPLQSPQGKKSACVISVNDESQNVVVSNNNNDSACIAPNNDSACIPPTNDSVCIPPNNVTANGEDKNDEEDDEVEFKTVTMARRRSSVPSNPLSELSAPISKCLTDPKRSPIPFRLVRDPEQPSRGSLRELRNTTRDENDEETDDVFPLRPTHRPRASTCPEALARWRRKKRIERERPPSPPIPRSPIRCYSREHSITELPRLQEDT